METDLFTNLFDVQDYQDSYAISADHSGQAITDLANKYGLLATDLPDFLYLLRHR